MNEDTLPIPFTVEALCHDTKLILKIDPANREVRQEIWHAGEIKMNSYPPFIGDVETKYKAGQWALQEVSKFHKMFTKKRKI